MKDFSLSLIDKAIQKLGNDGLKRIAVSDVSDESIVSPIIVIDNERMVKYIPNVSK